MRQKEQHKKTCNKSRITAQNRIHMYTHYFYVHKKTQKLHIEVPQSFFGSYDFSISSNDETIFFTAFRFKDSYVSGIRTIIIWYAVVSVETCVISACFHRVHQSSLLLSETSSSAFYLPILSLVKSLFYSFAPGGFGAPWTSGVGDHILVGPF